MKILLVMGFLLLTACSKGPQQKDILSKIITPGTQVSVSNLTSSVIFDDTRSSSQTDSQVIDFGTVKENTINLHRIYFKNSFNDSLQLNLDVLNSALSGSAFQFVKTDCSSSLIKDDVCFIDIKLVNDSSLSYLPLNIDIATIQENANFGKLTLVGQRGVLAPVKSYQFINVGQTINIEDSNKYVRVYVKNDGDKVIDAQITVPDEYSILKTSCDGVLPKGNVCFLDLTIKANLDSNIIGVNKPIDFDGNSFSIKAGANAPTGSIKCKPGHTSVDNSCVQEIQLRACNPQPVNSIDGYEESINGGVNWSSCLTYVCNSNHTKIGGVCTINNQTQSCLFANGSGERHSIDAGQTWGSCNYVSCNSSYTYIVGSNSCVLTNQNQACSITNGIGSQSSTDGGQNFGLCSVSSCNANYTQVGNACLQTNQTRSCTSQPANSNTGLESTTNGGVSWSVCAGYSCNTNYTNVEGLCVLSNQDKTCTILNGTGTQHSSDGGVSYGTCTVVNCNSNYSNVSNSCVQTNQSRSCVYQPSNSNTGVESTTNGGISWGSCTGYSCNTNYTNVSGTCILTNQDRSCVSQPVNSYLGLESTTNGGVSWGPCTGFSCNVGYVMDAGSCKIQIASYGTYKAWNNGTYAVSCNEYKIPGVGFKYSGL